MMNTKQIRLTQEGYQLFEQNLSQERERLDEATRIVQEQMENSTDSEDTGLEDAKREKFQSETRVEELEDILARAVLIESPADSSTVDLGALVVLSKAATKGKKAAEMTVKVVSAIEATVRGADSIPRVSEDSPVGSELMGRKVGDTFSVTLENGNQVKYKVVSVEYH